MRSQTDKDYISSTLVDPFSIQGFLSPDEVNQLIELYESGHGRIYKNTGPVTVNIKTDLMEHEVFRKIKDRLIPIIGDFNIYASFFFYVELPHILHNDDAFNFPLLHRGIALPLRIDYENENTGHPWLCFFDQYYLDGPSKFFNGSDNIPTYYNQCVYEYSQVQNLTDQPFPQEIKQRYLQHVKDNWLQGLSFQSAQAWIPGNAIIFSNCKLHCASDFRKQGIKSKLGISIFTEVPR
jgi:hypothetical protein